MENITVPVYPLDTVTKNVARNIRRAARAKHLTQKELANMTGLTECTLSRYMSGKYLPKGNALMSISIALEVSTDWLYFNQEN